MDILFNCKKDPCILKIGIETKKPIKICLSVKDKNSKNTFYTYGTMLVKSKRQELIIRMPITPDQAIINIYEKGDSGFKNDKSFKVVSLKKAPLETQLSAIDFKDTKLVLDFVRFATWFSKRAGVVQSKDSVYKSTDDKFRIDYIDVIKNKDGKPLNTPARVSANYGIIQVSKYHFMQYTVPMRMAVLLHEFSHFYLNNNKADETEADLNALLIYLGLGYPKAEAKQAFLKVFLNAPSDLNVKRYKIISNFIDNFDKMQFKKIHQIR